jgi:hypothetical protein
VNVFHELRSLYLQSNRITSIELNSFGDLVNLQTLHLEDNPISRISPHAFENLRSMSALYLQNTNLTSVPVAIESLISLSTLSLPPNLECDCGDKWLVAWLQVRTRHMYGSCGIAIPIPFNDYIHNDLELCP